jgi:predicted RNase H-like HicB family nuclease
MKYLVIFEKGSNSYGAYVPDLPGCVAAGETVEEARQLIQEAIPLHVALMRQSGQPIPEPSSDAEWVDVSAPAA